jgi:hypothetical protein
MRFRKIVLALFACLALGAFAANAAQAAEGEGWTIGTTENQTTAGTLIPKGTHEPITCKKHGTSSLVLTSTILGAPIEITAEGIDCVEATIDNTTSKGHSEGKLTFTGVKVVKPAGCSVPGGEITTEKLTDQVSMDTKVAGSTSVLDKFFTEGGPWDTVALAGAECPLAEISTPLNGTLCGEFAHTNSAGTGFEPNKTGTLTKVQTLVFGKAQQETGGCALTTGKAAATITGSVDFSLSGINVGKPWGVD